MWLSVNSVFQDPHPCTEVVGSGDYEDSLRIKAN